MHCHAMRIQNWEEYIISQAYASLILYLLSARLMLLWMAVYDSTNYTRYMSIYWVEMYNLNEDAKSYMEKGLFTASLTELPFSAIPHDQWIEMTVNKGSKMKGGWIGFTKNESMVNIHTHTDESMVNIHTHTDESMVNIHTHTDESMVNIHTHTDESMVNIHTHTDESMVNIHTHTDESMVNIHTHTDESMVNIHTHTDESMVNIHTHTDESMVNIHTHTDESMVNIHTHTDESMVNIHTHTDESMVNIHTHTDESMVNIHTHTDESMVNIHTHTDESMVNIHTHTDESMVNIHTHTDESMVNIHTHTDDMMQIRDTLHSRASLKSTKHAANSKSRLKTDESKVQDIIACLLEWDVNPWDKDKNILRSLESGFLSSKLLIADFNSAKNDGEIQIVKYFEERIKSIRKLITQTIPRNKRYTFQMSPAEVGHECKAPKRTDAMESKKRTDAME